jgi:hypothetical protein
MATIESARNQNEVAPHIPERRQRQGGCGKMLAVKCQEPEVS